MRTPLTTIKGSMEGLVDKVLPAHEETFMLDYQEADRLQRLVMDLQELSRNACGYRAQVSRELNYRRSSGANIARKPPTFYSTQLEMTDTILSGSCESLVTRCKLKLCKPPISPCMKVSNVTVVLVPGFSAIEPMAGTGGQHPSTTSR